MEVLKQIQEKQKRISLNPLKYAVQHVKQREASAARHLLRALFWGNRVGKTEWGAQEIAKIVLGEHEWIKPTDGWVFSPSFDDQKDTTQLKLLRYLPEHRIKKKMWLRSGVLKELVIDAGNKREARITFKSYEQGREKAQGAGKGWIWFDEEPPKDIFDECAVRSEAGIKLYIILTMTPIKGLTWVYRDIYLNTGNPDIFVSEADWDDNPYLTQEQKDAMARRLTAAALKVRKQGKFVKQVGLVCNWFDRAVHLWDPTKVQLPHGENFSGTDFGFSAPTATVYVRVDREMNVWVFDGFYRKGLINPDIQALFRVKEAGLGPIRRIGDSAQASDIKQLTDAGFAIAGVKKETGTSKENWDEFRARLLAEKGQLQELTGKPKIFISTRLVEYDSEGNEYNFLVKEIENLLWEEKKTMEGVEQSSIWGKQPKHAIDALTYILAEISKPNEEAQYVNNTPSGGIAGYDPAFGF